MYGSFYFLSRTVWHTGHRRPIGNFNTFSNHGIYHLMKNKVPSMQSQTHIQLSSKQIRYLAMLWNPSELIKYQLVQMAVDRTEQWVDIPHYQPFISESKNSYGKVETWNCWMHDTAIPCRDESKVKRCISLCPACPACTVFFSFLLSSFPKSSFWLFFSNFFMCRVFDSFLSPPHYFTSASLYTYLCSWSKITRTPQ